jgi:hypothetical protein
MNSGSKAKILGRRRNIVLREQIDAIGQAAFDGEAAADEIMRGEQRFEIEGARKKKCFGGKYLKSALFLNSIIDWSERGSTSAGACSFRAQWKMASYLNIGCVLHVTRTTK